MYLSICCIFWRIVSMSWGSNDFFCNPYHFMYHLNEISADEEKFLADASNNFYWMLNRYRLYIIINLNYCYIVHLPLITLLTSISLNEGLYNHLECQTTVSDYCICNLHMFPFEHRYASMSWSIAHWWMKRTVIRPIILEFSNATQILIYSL